MKFKLLKPRHKRRPKKKPLPPEAFAALSQHLAVKRRNSNRQATRRQTARRLACAREVTARKPV